MLFTDITGYYENIALEIVASDLRQLGVPENIVVALSTMLNKWAQSPGRSIPQGQSASDILGKVYLNTIDNTLRNNGIQHVRYVDDFRVFARSEHDAKQSLLLLSQLMRQRGLSLQTAKTTILNAADARAKIEELTRVIHEVRGQFIERARELFIVSPYPPLNEIEAFIRGSESINDTPIVIIREAYQNHFVDNYSAENFNKSLFHFLINRLGRVGDSYATNHCFDFLYHQPQETRDVLEYIARSTPICDWDDRLADFLDSPFAIYHYQCYQILEWRYRDDTVLRDRILAHCRKFAFDNNYPIYLRSIARALLGRQGNLADLERFMQIYPQTNSPLEQSELLCCLERLEQNRRNGFASRFRSDNNLNELAYRWLRRPPQ